MRLRPKVRLPPAGRAASRRATSERASAAASVSMCAASESSASECARIPATTSAAMKPRIKRSARSSARRLVPTPSSCNLWRWTIGFVRGYRPIRPIQILESTSKRPWLDFPPDERRRPCGFGFGSPPRRQRPDEPVAWADAGRDGGRPADQPGGVPLVPPPGGLERRLVSPRNRRRRDRLPRLRRSDLAALHPLAEPVRYRRQTDHGRRRRQPPARVVLAQALPLRRLHPGPDHRRLDLRVDRARLVVAARRPQRLARGHPAQAVTHLEPADHRSHLLPGQLPHLPRADDADGDHADPRLRAW